MPIQITGTAVLHRRAAPVTEITPRIIQLVDDMVETMHAAPGVGLAAPQVGVGLQVFVWSYDDAEVLHEGHILNPKLTTFGGLRARLERDPAEEGCLSIPGARAPLARAPRVRLEGMDLGGNHLQIDATGWLARIFQHEYDHLQGVLYRDRLRRARRSEVDEIITSHGWGRGIAQWLPGVDGEESDFTEGGVRA